jgi:mono/diheme cytochrome c family protein
MNSSVAKRTIKIALTLCIVFALLISWQWQSESLTTVTPEDSVSRQLFDTEIVALLDRRCSNCHGVSVTEYAKLEADPANTLLLRWPVDATGRISSPKLREVAYERARTTRTEGGNKLVPIDPGNPALASKLLLAPLSETYAGMSMVHPVTFTSPTDSDFRMLQQWVQTEIDAQPAAVKASVTPAERFFVDQVTPILERKSCFGSNCHGLGVFNDLKLHPGVPVLEGRFTAAMHQQNRLSMLGRNSAQINMVHLSGDIEQSRQLLKNIPISQGGILHKGGNNFFNKGDPDYALLLQWLKLEKEEAAEQANAALGEQRGILFVRRPRNLPQRYFEDADFLPGGDLIWLYAGKEINLTAALHPDGAADIRTPDVSYDAQRVVFSMRRNEHEALNIWELELDTQEARQLTFSTDPAVHFQDPQYIPDHTDSSGVQLNKMALAMVSNISGEWAASSPEGILGEAEGGNRKNILDTELTARAGTYDGHVIRIVRGTNQGQTRNISRQVSGKITVDKAFENPCDTTTHYVIETVARLAPSYDLYRINLAAKGLEQEAYKETLSRLTFGLGQIRRPSMRSSGEIMFTTLRTGWQSDRPFYNAAVFRTFYNGGNYHTHYGNRSVVSVLSDNNELPNGLEVRVGRDADSYWGGALLVSDHQFGPTIDPANPIDDLDHPFANGMPKHGMHQFFRGWVSLDDDVTMHGISAGGAYRDPYPAPDGTILVAYAPGPIDLSDPEQAPDFNIIRLRADPSLQSADGLKGGLLQREQVVGNKNSSELWPRPVVVRAKQQLKKSPKWATDLFGKPGTEKGLPAYSEDTPAQLVVFDLVLLDVFFEQNLPAGERKFQDKTCTDCGADYNTDDQISYARVIGAQPLAAGEAGPPKRYIIAEVPLETDGSFQVVIPSLVNFDIQSLNAERMALHSPNRWLYTLPGEKHTLSIPRMLYTQTCAGCHGTLSGKHTNTFGRPDAISSASKTLAVWDDKEHTSLPPANYDVTTKQYRTDPFAVGFEEDIKPILARRCASCHNSTKAEARLNLAADNAFAQLREQVDYRQALAIHSPLLETLLGRELRAPEPLASNTSHVHNSLLPRAELRQVIRWVDLGAPQTRAKLK